MAEVIAIGEHQVKLYKFKGLSNFLVVDNLLKLNLIKIQTVTDKM